MNRPNRTSTEFNGSGYDQSDVESLGCRQGGGRRGRAVARIFWGHPDSPVMLNCWVIRKTQTTNPNQQLSLCWDSKHLILDGFQDCFIHMPGQTMLELSAIFVKISWQLHVRTRLAQTIETKRQQKGDIEYCTWQGRAHSLRKPAEESEWWMMV